MTTKHNNIFLKIPTKDELWYRIKLLSDADTMSFNPNGCYHITQEQAEKWYKNWVNVPGKFYAYIALPNNTFIGEANIHFDIDTGLYMIGIIIDASMRNKGYAKQALKLLTWHAFNKMNLDKIADKFPAERTAAEKVFTDIGFIRQENDLLVLTKNDFINSSNKTE